MNFNACWLIFAIIGAILKCVEGATGNCSCRVNVNVASICVLESRLEGSPKCGIGIPTTKVSFCERNLENADVTYDVGTRVVDYSAPNEIHMFCNAPYPLDFSYDGPAPLTAVKLDYGRKDGLSTEGTIYALNITVAVDPRNSGNYTLYSIHNSSFSTKLEISTRPSDQQDFDTTDQSTAEALLDLIPFNKSSGADWIVCTSNTRGSPQRLINLVTNNPAESKYLKECIVGDNVRCFNRREANLRQCSKYGLRNYTCKAMDLKPPGGLISCFNAQYNSTNEYLVGLDNHFYFADNETNKFSMVPGDVLISIKKYNNSYISGLSYKFSCTATSYLLAEGLAWYFQYENQSMHRIASSNSIGTSLGILERLTNEVDQLLPRFRLSTLFVQVPPDAARILCVGYWYDSDKSVNASTILQVERSYSPRFDANVTNNEFIPTAINRLDCLAAGLPTPRYKWILDNKVPRNFREVPNSTIVRTNVSRLVFDNKVRYAYEEFTVHCVARNQFGSSIKTFHVRVVDPNTTPYGMYAGISLAVCVITSVVVATICHFTRRRNQRGLTPEEEEEFRKGSKRLKDTGDGMNIFPATLPFKDEFEIKENDLQICEDQVLGQGEFGIVLKGKYHNVDVAIKTLKSDSTKEDLKCLLSELKVMVYVGQNSNIIRLIGAVVEHLRSGKVYVVVEYCSLGCLQNYIRENRTRFIDQFRAARPTTFEGYVSYSNVATFTTKVIYTEDLLKWALQIGSGMEYLSEINVVHGDLATRNVLLDETGTAKISDFGLSRKLYSYAQYVKKSQEPLPWRWLAIESLCDLTFSTESDVWSFGVTLWEIFSLAEIPYPGLNWSLNFADALRAGMRLRKPEWASLEIYEVMRSCWNSDPTARPKFIALNEALSKIHKKLSNNNEMTGT